MRTNVAYGLRVAVVAAALLSGSACGTAGASEEEVAVVCTSMSEASRYGGMVDGVSVAHDTLIEDYGRSPAEASEIITDVVMEQCPEFRRQL